MENVKGFSKAFRTFRKVSSSKKWFFRGGMDIKAAARSRAIADWEAMRSKATAVKWMAKCHISVAHSFGIIGPPWISFSWGKGRFV